MDLKDLLLDIYLVRHADPAGVPNHWITPTTPLSQFGINQAKKQAQHLRNQHFEFLITSPLLRAKQTAELIALKCKPVRLQEESWLSEIDLGEWTGRHKEEIKQQIPTSLKRLLEEGYDRRGPLVANLLMIDKEFSFPLGESLKDFWNRVTTGFNQTLDHFKGKLNQRICLIGHGGSFTVIILNLLGKSFSDLEFPVFMFGKADLTIIRIKNGKVFFLQINPIFHQKMD